MRRALVGSSQILVTFFAACVAKIAGSIRPRFAICLRAKCARRTQQKKSRQNGKKDESGSEHSVRPPLDDIEYRGYIDQFLILFPRSSYFLIHKQLQVPGQFLNLLSLFEHRNGETLFVGLGDFGAQFG